MNKKIFNSTHIALLLIILLSFFLSFFLLHKSGFLNEYYAVSVRSMLTSFKNWFFLSYDPNGFLSVDKPPLGLWIQSLCVLIFGFNIYSLVLPQAISASLSVLLIFIIVKRYFGSAEGLISSLTLAVTPIFIALTRNTKADLQMIFILLLAFYFLILSVEKGKIRFLFISFIFFGLAFNIKSLQTFLVLPAFLIFYFFSVNKNIKLGKIKKAVLLFIGFNILMIIGLSWNFIVDNTPKDKRPFVGGSISNTRMDLTFGYNGIIRLMPGDVLNLLTHRLNNSNETQQEKSFDDETTNFFELEIGRPGFLRMINYQMADQITWMLPVIIFGFIAAFLILKKNGEDERNKFHFVMFWIAWLVPSIIIFSIVGFIHRHYVNMLSCGFAALTGIGAVSLWKLYKNEKSGISILLSVALLLNCAYSIFILKRYYNWKPVWIMIPLCILGIILSIVLIIIKLIKIDFKYKDNIKIIITSFIFVILFLPCFVWSLTPMIYGDAPILSYAGPNLKMPPLEEMTANQKEISNLLKKIYYYKLTELREYLERKYEHEKYLVAIPNVILGTNMMLVSGKPVMAMGGYYGRDKILSPEKLKELAGNNDVKYFLLTVAMELPDDITNWIIKNCEFIEPSEWREEYEERIKADNIDILYGMDYEKLMIKSLRLYRYKR